MSRNENLAGNTQALDANTIRANLMARIEAEQEEHRAGSAIIAALKPFHGKQVTRRFLPALKAALPDYLISYEQGGSGMFAHTDITFWQGSWDRRHTLRIWEARQDRFDWDWMRNEYGGKHYLTGLPESIATMQDWLEGWKIEREVEQYNAALAEFLKTRAAFEPISYNVFRTWNL